MKNKSRMTHPQYIDQNGGGIPNSCYILLGIIFIGIIYLLVLKQRIEEFFIDNNQPINNQPINQLNNSNGSANNNANDNSNNKANNITIKDDMDIFFVKQEVNPFEINKVWEGKLNNKYLSIWQRTNKKTMDLYSMGQFAHVSNIPIDALPDDIIRNAPVLNMLFKGGKFPLKYIKIWSSDMANKKPEKDLSIWQPVPSEGYIAMGDIVVPSLSPPSRNRIVCLPIKYLVNNKQIKNIILEYPGNNPMTLWNVGNYKTFMTSASKNKPEARKDDIMDLSEEALTQKEHDSTEKYKGLNVEIATFKLSEDKMLNVNNSNNSNNVNSMANNIINNNQPL